MLDVSTIPGVKEGDFQVYPCGLEVKPLGRFTDEAAAWSVLPAEGSGVVVLSDSVVRYKGRSPSGLLVDADVVSGNTTVCVRLIDEAWHAWSWTELKDGAHWAVERAYLTSEPGSSDLHIYRTYWGETQSPDNGIQVLQPVGSRFCGFKEQN